MVGHIWKKNPGSEDTTGSHVATLPVARKFHYRTTLDYDMNHIYSFLDIVFTSFLWQNQIKLIKLCILIKCGDFIAWACRYYLTTYLYLI